MPVSELIYTGDYTIDANGMQIPNVQSNAEITANNVDEVMAQYSDQLKAAGFTDDQLQLAAQAVKNGAEVPDEVYEALAEYTFANSEAASVTEEITSSAAPAK